MPLIALKKAREVLCEVGGPQFPRDGWAWGSEQEALSSALCPGEETRMEVRGADVQEGMGPRAGGLAGLFHCLAELLPAHSENSR